MVLLLGALGYSTCASVLSAFVEQGKEIMWSVLTELLEVKCHNLKLYLSFFQGTVTSECSGLLLKSGG